MKVKEVRVKNRQVEQKKMDGEMKWRNKEREKRPRC